MYIFTGSIVTLATSLLVANLTQPNIKLQQLKQHTPSNSSAKPCQVQMNQHSTTQEQVYPDRNLPNQSAPQLTIEERERLLEKTEIEPQSVPCPDMRCPVLPNQNPTIQRDQ